MKCNSLLKTSVFSRMPYNTEGNAAISLTEDDLAFLKSSQIAVADQGEDDISNDSILKLISESEDLSIE